MGHSMRGGSVDEAEVAGFDRLGEAWWDPRGPMKALHKFNPVRVAYLRDKLVASAGSTAEPLSGLRILDIGCGGGLLSESLAALGANVTALDPAPRNIEIASAHAQKSGLAIDYRCTTVEAYAAECATSNMTFDAVLTMEVLEHVRNPKEFLRHAASLVKPDGLLFAATLNRTLKSYALAIVGAEYILGWVERGTHDWQRFLTPDELASMLEKAGLEIIDETGVVYEPLADRWKLGRDMGVNYILTARRPQARRA